MPDIPIPDRLIDKAFDSAIDFLRKRVKELPGGDTIANKMEQLHSEAGFRIRFRKAVQEVSEQFDRQFRVEDEDLVQAIVKQVKEGDFLENDSVQQALITILQRPDRFLESEQEIIQKYFESLFPERLNRERVNRAVSRFLTLLAESVWMMPEFRDSYQLLLGKITADTARRQLQLTETQVRINDDIRKLLVELTEVVTRRQLDSREQPALGSPPQDTVVPEGLELPVASRGVIVREKEAKADWGDTFDVTMFYGRDDELEKLRNWIADDHCNLIGVFGLGGIGKTALTTKLAHQIEDQFDFIFCRSLLSPRPLKEILGECIRFLSHQRDIDLPDNTYNRIARLMTYVRESRCLIILDNIEGILREGSSGSFAEGYEDYGRLFEQLGSSEHKSCLLFTSQDKPVQFVLLEGHRSLVRSLPLSGLKSHEASRILDHYSLTGSNEEKQMLIDRYSGNPMYLRIVADTIRSVYRGNVGDFLREVEDVLDPKADLAKEFRRSSSLEQELLIWFAIEREPITREILVNDILQRVPKSEIVLALRSLLNRSLVEQGVSGMKLQNVVTGYITDYLVRQIYTEIETGNLQLFKRHALIKAQSKDYVRNVQVQLIIRRLADRLLDAFRRREAIAERLMALITPLRGKSSLDCGYAAGNVLNLLSHLAFDMSGLDFSRLPIWQAYLQGVELHNVNFAFSDLSRTVFTETFASILSVSVSPAGNLLVAGSINGNVYLWDLPEGRLLHVFSGHSDWVRSVAFSPDGGLIASASYDQTIRLWNASTGEGITSLHGHGSWVTSVDFSPDGKILASGSLDRTLKLWDCESGQLIRTLEGHQGGVQAVKFNTDGNLIASGSSDHTVRLWDINRGDHRTLIGHTDEVWAIDFNLDGTILASGSYDRTARLWDVNTGELIANLHGHDDRLLCIAFNSKGNRLASGSSDQTIRIWNISTGQCEQILLGHENWVWSADFLPMTDTLVSGGFDQTVRIWDANTGQLLKAMRGHDVAIRAIAFHPKENLLASGGNDNLVRLWDVNKGLCINKLQGHTKQLWSVAFSPDGQILVSGGEDRTIRVWNVNTGKCLKILYGHESWINVAFNQNGSILASSGTDDKMIKLWNTSSWECFKTLQVPARVWGVAFSPDSMLLASGHFDQVIRIWDTSTGDCVKTLTGHVDQVWSVAFSPNGKMLASSSEDKTIRLWETEKWNLVRILTGHASWILTAQFSPDGSLLVSEGSDDDSVRVWKIPSGDCIRIWQTYRPWSVAFNFDGTLIGNGSYDGTIKLWDVETGKHLRTLNPQRLYENMDITHVSGLTDMQKVVLKALGAIEKN